jgi:hypothetical protein
MKENEPRDEPSDPGRHVSSAEVMYEDEILLRPILRILWSYRRAIVGVVAGVMVVFATVAAAVSSIAPVERTGTLGFRLLFDGASEGRYPNGTPFTNAEITSTPVLTEVFNVNTLERFGSFEAFRNSVFVLSQLNPELDALSFAYQTKLSDLELTPVDRSRLEDEFQAKRDSLNPSYTLNLRASNRIAAMPRSLTAKVLDNTLAIWATQASERKGALHYDTPVLSRNILKRHVVMDDDYLTGIDVLRTQIVRMITNIDQIERLPGAALLRTGDDRISLRESKVELEDILRFQIRSLFGMLRETGLSNSPSDMQQYIKDQLFQIRLDREQAEKSVQALQAALRAYMGQKGARAIQTTDSGLGGRTLGQAPGNQAMVPQFGDSVVERLVEMSTLNIDADYRQMLTDRVITESLVVAKLGREQANYEETMRSLQGVRTPTEEGGRDIQRSQLQSGLNEAFDAVTRVIDNANAIYQELSTYNLNPSTLLYSITTGFTLRTERSVSVRDLGIQGLLVLVLSLIIVPFGCLGHSYFQREIVHQETDEQGVRKSLEEQAKGLHAEEPAKRRPSSS